MEKLNETRRVSFGALDESTVMQNSSPDVKYSGVSYLISSNTPNQPIEDPSQHGVKVEPLKKDEKLFTDMDYPRKLRHALVKSLKTGEFSDVTIECMDGQTFRVHRNILSMTCSYFQTMFTSSFSESQKSQIELKDVEGKDFQDILTYLYCGELLVTKSNVVGVAKLADMFGLLSLHEYSCEFMVSLISHENCLGFMKLGKELNAIKLSKAASRFAVQHFEYVVKQDEFLQMDPDDLCNYINQPALKVACEEEVFKHALRWLHTNVSERVEHFKSVLCNLHLLDIDLSFLKCALTKISAIRRSTEVMSLLQRLQDHAIARYPLPSDLLVLTPRLNVGVRKGVLFLLHDANSSNAKRPSSLYWVTPFDVSTMKRKNMSNVNPFGNSFRLGLSSCAVGTGSIYVSGLGNDSEQLVRYEINLNRWQSCAAIPQPRKHHSIVYGTDNKLYIVGGYREDETGRKILESDILEYDCVSNVWSKCGQLNTGVFQCGAVFTQGDILVIGGLTLINGSHSEVKVLENVQKFDTFTSQCTTLSVTLPISSAIKKVFLPRDKLLVITESNVIVVPVEMLSSDEHSQAQDIAAANERTFIVIPHVFGAHFTCEILGRRLLVLTKNGAMSGVKWQQLLRDDYEPPVRADFFGKLPFESSGASDSEIVCCDAVPISMHASTSLPQGSQSFDVDN